MKFEKVARWCDAAELGLARALGDYADDVRTGVNDGRLELWRVDGDSWLVTQASKPRLIVWCYQGHNLRAVTDALFRVARRNGLEEIEFGTKRRGLHRLLKGFGFELVMIDADEISVYQALVA